VSDDLPSGDDAHLAESLRSLIKAREGYAREIHIDNNGVPVGGYGHQFAVGTAVPHHVADWYLTADISTAQAAVIRVVHPEGRRHLCRARYAVLVDMAFNMGASDLAKFTEMLKAIKIGDWDWAAAEIRDSDYWRNPLTTSRAEANAVAMETGCWPEVRL
jgi:GH24 family phage-related lysozyme (muramidase)